MRLVRTWLIVVLVAVVLGVAGLAVPVRAQSQRKVIKISVVSYKYTPNLITVQQGDTVVLQLSNDDPDGRSHSIAARLFGDVPATVRGDVTRQGVDDGRRFFTFDVGKRIEVEFVATKVGSFPFICGISDHASRGHTGAINVLATSP